MSAIRTPWQSLFGLVVILMVAAMLPAAPTTGVWWHDFAKAEAEARKLDRPILVHFHASWCGPCQSMEAEVLSSADLKAALADRVVGVKVDFDDHPELAERFGVDVLPYDLILAPNGKVLSRRSGYQTRQTYLATLAQHERKYADSRKTQLASTPVTPIPATTPATPNKTPDAKAGLIEPNSLTGDQPQGWLALEGYCPVTLWRTRQWVKGNSSLIGDYQGLKFRFATAEDRADFEKNPLQYVPRLLGCDPVLLAETERAFGGSSKFAAFYDGELYLFTSAATRAKFRENPPHFTQTRHVRLEDIQREDTRLGMKN